MSAVKETPREAPRSANNVIETTRNLLRIGDGAPDELRCIIGTPPTASLKFKRTTSISVDLLSIELPQSSLMYLQYMRITSHDSYENISIGIHIKPYSLLLYHELVLPAII